MDKKLKTKLRKEINRLIALCGDKFDLIELLGRNEKALLNLPLGLVSSGELFGDVDELLTVTDKHLTDDSCKALISALEVLDEDDCKAFVKEIEAGQREAKERRKLRLRQEEQAKLHVHKKDINLERAIGQWETLISTYTSIPRTSLFAQISDSESDADKRIKLSSNINLLRRLYNLSNFVSEDLSSIESLLHNPNNTLTPCPRHLYDGWFDIKDNGSWAQIAAAKEITIAPKTIALFSIGLYLRGDEAHRLTDNITSKHPALERCELELISRHTGVGDLLINAVHSNDTIIIPQGDVLFDLLIN